MAIDLLALLQGNGNSAKPGNVRSDASGSAPQPPASNGPKVPVFAVGAYIIKVPAPSPSYAATASSPGRYIASFGPSGSNLQDPDATGNYFFVGNTRYAPDTFYLKPLGYTDTKSTADVPLNQRLYTALVRSTK